MVGLVNPPPNLATILPANLGHDVAEKIAKNDVQIDGYSNPFATWIMEYEMLANFKFVVQIDPYDGTTDPQDHVKNFQQTMVLQGAKEAVICRAFPLSLKAAARRWFSSLIVGSISGWKSLKDKFILNFTSNKQ
jgi:hypothetical protein